MRVLFTTWALGSHYNPLVPLGWALRAAGHEVMVASHPSLAPTITEAGLPALPAGPDVDLLARLRAELAEYHDQLPELHVRVGEATDNDGRPMRNRDKPGNRSGLATCRVAAWSAEQMIDDILAFSARWKPDLVVFEPMSFAGPLAARILGIPSVRHLWTVDYPVIVRRLEHVIMADLAARFGLQKVGLIGDMTLDPCPPALEVQDGLQRQPMRYVSYNGPSVQPEWLREPPARPRVCVTAGKTLDELGMNHMVLAPYAVRALADFDVEVVVAVVENQRAMFDPLPDNVISVGPVPLQLLLPSCTAIVHQGGSGGTMTALANGLPQLVLPHLPDQMFTAEQLYAAGVGRIYTGEQARADGEDAIVPALREHLSALFEPGYAASAERLAAQSRTLPTPAEVVPLLERLASPAGTPADYAVAER